MKTDLTSNHLKIPGNLYAVKYTVLSIHIFCKYNTGRLKTACQQVYSLYRNPRYTTLLPEEKKVQQYKKIQSEKKRLQME